MKAYVVTFDKTDSVSNIILKRFLQKQMGHLDESEVNESIKEKVDQFLHSYGKVKLNLQVLYDGCIYYWTARFFLIYKSKQMLSNTQRLNICYLKIIPILHPRYHPKKIDARKNVSEFMRLYN